VDNTKLEWYYHTYEEDDYRLHKAQYEGVKDYYEAKGYNVSLDTGGDEELGWKLWLTVENIIVKPRSYRD